MAHITLSIPDPIHAAMKAHPEIKWSEIARQSIIKQLQKVEGAVSGKELFRSLSKEAQKVVEEVSKLEWEKFYAQMKKKEWKRTTSLTQPSS